MPAPSRQAQPSPLAFVTRVQRSLGLLSGMVPCIFFALLPVQVFPETVKAVFVSQPLPEHKGTVSDTAHGKHHAKHQRRGHKARTSHPH